MAEIKDKDFGSYHIASELEYEHARSGFFSFIVNDIDNLVRSDFGEEEPEDSDKIKDGVEKLKLSVIKVNVPHFSTTTIETRRGNSVVKYAGVPTFNSGEITVQDYLGLSGKSILMAWQALTYDVINDKGGRAKNYKKNCTLIEYTQDYKKVRSWDLIGCWPSEISEAEFDKSADSERTITATIQFDRAIMHDESEETFLA